MITPGKPYKMQTNYYFEMLDGNLYYSLGKHSKLDIKAKLLLYKT